MSKARYCIECGASLPDAARGGLCCTCALRGALNCPPAEAGPEASHFGDLPSFGDYVLLEEIGCGGMGIVYKAHQKSLNRIVALKMMLSGKFANPEMIQRFRKEAEAIAQLQHPHIVTIHEVGQHENLPYFSMDYIQGRTLEDIVRDGPLPSPRAATYIRAIAEAIHYAHRHGILHRDLKPSNILIDGSDEPHIADFGLAKRQNSDSSVWNEHESLTISGQVLGSPNYLSPEQASGRSSEIGPASDVYALGAMLYHLLTGRPPFHADSLTTLLREVIEAEPVAPRLLNASIPRDLETICLKCLDKERLRRYATAQALADDLLRFLNHEAVAARPTGPVGRMWRWCRRWPVRAGLIAALVLSVGLGAGGVVWQWRRATVNAMTAQQNLYAADMRAAQLCFERGNLGRARHLLKAHWPGDQERDLRGFEWRYLWNQCRGDQVQTFVGHSQKVAFVTFSHDGHTLVSGLADSTVKLWDVATCRVLAELPTGFNGSGCMAMSGNGDWLATAGLKGPINFWDSKSRRILYGLDETNVARLAFSPVKTWVAIGYGHPVFGDVVRGPVKLWDYAGRQLVRMMPEPGSRLAFSPDGRILAARSGSDSVKLWEVETGREVRKLDGAGDLQCLSFSPDGLTVAGGNWAGEVLGWNVPTGRRVLTLRGHSAQVCSLAFSPDGHYLASASGDQTVRLWNSATGKEAARLIGHDSEVMTVAFAPHGRTLATGGHDGMVMLWNVTPKRAGQILTSVHLPPSFSKDGRLMATARQGGPITIWEVATRQPIWVLDRECFAEFQGDTLVTVSTNFILRYWQVSSRTLEREVALPSSIRSRLEGPLYRFPVAVGGDRVAAVDRDGTVILLEPTTGRVIAKLNTGTKKVYELRFSADARRLVVGGENPAVTLWDALNGTALGEVSSPREVVQGLALSPDGSRLATASFSGRVWMVSIATGRAESPLTNIKLGCAGVAFSPDNQTLAVACEDGMVRLWNLATRREVAELKHGQVPLRFVVFSSDGQMLVSVCEDGFLRFWDGPHPVARQLRPNLSNSMYPE